jgi:hypothetical protein
LTDISNCVKINQLVIFLLDALFLWKIKGAIIFENLTGDHTEKVGCSGYIIARGIGEVRVLVSNCT